MEHIVDIPEIIVDLNRLFREVLEVIDGRVEILCTGDPFLIGRSVVLRFGIDPYEASALFYVSRDKRSQVYYQILGHFISFRAHHRTNYIPSDQISRLDRTTLRGRIFSDAASESHLVLNYGRDILEGKREWIKEAVVHGFEPTRVCDAGFAAEIRSKCFAKRNGDAAS